MAEQQIADGSVGFGDADVSNARQIGTGPVFAFAGGLTHAAQQLQRQQMDPASDPSLTEGTGGGGGDSDSAGQPSSLLMKNRRKTETVSGDSIAAKAFESLSSPQPTNFDVFNDVAPVRRENVEQNQVVVLFNNLEGGFSSAQPCEFAVVFSTCPNISALSLTPGALSEGGSSTPLKRILLFSNSTDSSLFPPLFLLSGLGLDNFEEYLLSGGFPRDKLVSASHPSSKSATGGGGVSGGPPSLTGSQFPPVQSGPDGTLDMMSRANIFKTGGMSSQGHHHAKTLSKLTFLLHLHLGDQDAVITLTGGQGDIGDSFIKERFLANCKRNGADYLTRIVAVTKHFSDLLLGSFESVSLRDFAPAGSSGSAPLITSHADVVGRLGMVVQVYDAITGGNRPNIMGHALDALHTRLQLPIAHDLRAFCETKLDFVEAFVNDVMRAGFRAARDPQRPYTKEAFVGPFQEAANIPSERLYRDYQAFVVPTAVVKRAVTDGTGGTPAATAGGKPKKQKVGNKQLSVAVVAPGPAPAPAQAGGGKKQRGGGVPPNLGANAKISGTTCVTHLAQLLDPTLSGCTRSGCVFNHMPLPPSPTSRKDKDALIGAVNKVVKSATRKTEMVVLIEALA